MRTDELLYRIDEQEALALLSMLNCTVKDWPAIKKLGGAKNVLASNAIAASLNQRPAFAAPNLRAQFDRFYESNGFLFAVSDHEEHRLFRCDRAPLTFFGRFNRELLHEVSVAVVGARAATIKGMAIAQNAARHLVKNSITVISGGAAGIDQAAHRAALVAGGKTIVVSGVVCDFKKSTVPALEIPHDREQTAVLYPYGPFIPQAKYMFVERSRFVVAHAHALLVVEGRRGSGTLHTARFAEAASCPIFAVSHESTVHGYVPNYLLHSHKARDMATFDQFVEALVTNRQKPLKSPSTVVKDHMGKTEALTEQPYLLQIISDHKNSLGFDDLLVLTGLSFGELQRELLSYELQGRIFKRGAQFVLTGD